MKSKVQFDLDYDNSSVIVAKVEASDDVRDKIAQNFKNQFHLASNLCTVRFNDHGEIVIFPLSGSYEIAQKQMWPISSEQMSQLIVLFILELAGRGVTVDIDNLTKDYLQAEKKYKKNSLTMKNVSV